MFTQSSLAAHKGTTPDDEAIKSEISGMELFLSKPRNRIVQFQMLSKREKFTSVIHDHFNPRDFALK